MNGTAWYILIEEDQEKFESTDPSGIFLHQWRLARSLHVDGNQEAAEAKAAELAASHVPGWIAKYVNPDGRPQRSVFRMADGSRLVTVKARYDQAHFRVSIAELVLTEEEIAGTSKVKEQPSKKGLFRR